jgi:ElaB/YqjD/DUF883 family membrane-anchored ribosome-binding protein
MAAESSIAAELGAMRDELAQAGAAHTGETTPPADPAALPTCRAELQSLIHELETKWGEASENAEELVKSHPVAALASAFLVGMALGRLMGR